MGAKEICIIVRRLGAFSVWNEYDEPGDGLLPGTK